MNWNPVAKINLAAMRHNLSVARRCVSGAKIISVIKSQAYGHGLIEVARALQHATDAFAVARLHEGVTLRKHRITKPVLILEGMNDADELHAASAHDLQLVIHHSHQIDLLQHAILPQPVSCWLKFDTGMHRLGLPTEEASNSIAQVRASGSVDALRLMTHLSCADDLANSITGQQLTRMTQITQQYPLETTIANSAGILRWPPSHADWVRPGLMLYGASPIIGHAAAQYNLQPAMTLQARLISVKPIKRGASVGYAGIWQAPEDMLLGVVGIGYGDGYPRQIKPAAQVLLKGQRVPVVGRVSMDMLTIDLRGSEAGIGDRVTLWGDGLPIDEVAAWANTIPYTLMCGVTARVEREYSAYVS